MTDRARENLAPEEHQQPKEHQQPVQRLKLGHWLGSASLVLAIAGSIVEAIAISLAATSPEPATVLAWVVIAILSISLVGGVAAIVRRDGRLSGIAAVAVSLLANPLVLVWLFDVLGGS